MARDKNLRAGVIQFHAGERRYDAVGEFKYNLGANKREGLAGSDSVHGYEEMPQVPYIEGEVRDSASLSVDVLVNLKDVTVTLQLFVDAEEGPAKIVTLSEAWYAGDGEATSKGVLPVRFEGMSAGEQIL